MKRREWIRQIRNESVRYYENKRILPKPCCLTGQLTEAQGELKANNTKQQVAEVNKNVEARNNPAIQNHSSTTGSKEIASSSPKQSEQKQSQNLSNQQSSSVDQNPRSQYQRAEKSGILTDTSQGNLSAHSVKFSTSPSTLIFQTTFSSSARPEIKSNVSSLQKPPSEKGEKFSRSLPGEPKVSAKSESAVFFHAAAPSSPFQFLLSHAEKPSLSKGETGSFLTNSSRPTLPEKSREVRTQNLILQRAGSAPLPTTHRGLLLAFLRHPAALLALPPNLRAFYLYANRHAESLQSIPEHLEVLAETSIPTNEIADFSLTRNLGFVSSSIPETESLPRSPDWMKRLGSFMNRFSKILLGNYLPSKEIKEFDLESQKLFDELSGLKSETIKKKNRKRFRKKKKSDRIAMKKEGGLEDQWNQTHSEQDVVTI